MCELWAKLGTHCLPLSLCFHPRKLAGMHTSRDTHPHRDQASGVFYYSLPYSFKMLSLYWAGEVTQWLEHWLGCFGFLFFFFPEEPGSLHSTHTVAHNGNFPGDPKLPSASSGTRSASDKQTYMQAKHVYIRNKHKPTKSLSELEVYLEATRPVGQQSPSIHLSPPLTGTNSHAGLLTRVPWI